MGLVDDGGSKPGFFSSIFSKSKETPPAADSPTRDKTNEVSALREFVKAPASPRFNLFGRAKEVVTTPTPERPPINKTAIHKQAEHINAVRDSKLWAADNVSKPLGTSANEVHALKGRDPEETTAFFKIGSDNESASGVMEEFMWKTANVLGDAKHFVATSQSTVKMKEAAPSNAAAERSGGIQTAQKAITLAKYIDHPPGWKLAKPDILKASLITMVYGMGDAHAENILVSGGEPHEIAFFDNTRSLPAGNAYLDRGYGIVSSYRSGLMELQESYDPLTQEDIQQLKQQLSEYKANYNNLKSYMNSAQTIHNLSSLPPGWMNREEALNAMAERISRLEKALNSNDVINLRDLAMAMSPQYKTAAAFEIVNKMIESKGLLQAQKLVKGHFEKGVTELTGQELNDILAKFKITGNLDPKATFNETAADNLIQGLIDHYPPPNYASMSLTAAHTIQKQALGSVGYRTMDNLFEICANAGIDPAEISNLCDDPFKSFDELVMDIGVLVERDFGTEEKSPRPELLANLALESELDLKDIEREGATRDTLEFTCANLEKAGIWDNIEVLDESPPRMILRYEFHGQEQIHYLDYITVPGKVIVQLKGKELPPMTPSELKEWMENRTMPKGSEGFQQLMAKFGELQIPLRALNPIEAIREARNLKPGEYFIAQERGASVPKLKVYLLNSKNQIESYDLKYNSKLELTIKLGTIEKSLSAEKLKELLIKSSK